LIAPTLRKIPNSLELVPESLRENPFLDQLLLNGLETLVSTADRFGVEDHHAQEVADIMKAFGVTDADLREFVLTWGNSE